MWHHQLSANDVERDERCTLDPHAGERSSDVGEGEQKKFIVPMVHDRVPESHHEPPPRGLTAFPQCKRCHYWLSKSRQHS